MTMLLAVNETSVPRFHIERYWPDGMLRLLDRFTGQQLVIYMPRRTQQFQAGHRAGKWYARPSNDLGDRPASQSFATAKSAMEGVMTGGWGLHSRAGNGLKGLVRVIWPKTPLRRSAS